MTPKQTPHVLVIGAGVGGLTTAVLLLHAGYKVTVLEAHIYPGGCAGTFYHQKFRFDVGATLAGGFSPGGPHARLAELLGIEWPVRPVDPAWITYLDDRAIVQWAERERWWEEIHRHFPESAPFWKKQEWLAAQSWNISAKDFPWPPRSLGDTLKVLRALEPATLLAAPYAWRKISDLLPAKASRTLRAFLDAQLLISAQSLAHATNALYGSAALDLPRRGVNHIRGGIGNLAQTLAKWGTDRGLTLLYRQKVERLEVKDGRGVRVYTNKKQVFEADAFVANLTPWGLAVLLGEDAPSSLRREVRTRPPTWGAFTLYLGLDANRLPPLPADHFQVIADPSRPLGEGNSVFISLSPPDDPSRAPQGMRAATLSTHTAIAQWQIEESAYEERRAEYTERMIGAAEIAIPGIRQAIRLALPGTPHTFEFYTHRPLGMVGGFPQTSLWRARGPWTGLANVWLVGDSIFPGQSTAGVTLGAVRVANEVLRWLRQEVTSRSWVVSKSIHSAKAPS
ncbi:MAG: NAD(P)/FAD-dependent oxidoreductase [Anaerolineales bacterium]|nr:NAD(P)/FAD-dependent oxidoreductase [Anaerolineales bacterium]MDW8162507.1 FAD-dependent oxidoreductase [Anaerolineales bacterium]